MYIVFYAYVPIKKNEPSSSLPRARWLACRETVLQQQRRRRRRRRWRQWSRTVVLFFRTQSDDDNLRVRGEHCENGRHSSVGRRNLADGSSNVRGERVCETSVAKSMGTAGQQNVRTRWAKRIYFKRISKTVPRQKHQTVPSLLSK